MLWKPVIIGVCLVAGSAPEGEFRRGRTRYRLTLDRALELARTGSPAVRAAAARIDEARGELVGASVSLVNNPGLDVSAGPRWLGSDGRITDYGIGVSQLFELGGRRRARREAATAAIDRAAADARDAARRALRDVAFAFLFARHAEESLRMAAETEAVSAELLGVTRSRFEAGDVGVLDVRLASLAVERVRAESRRFRATHERALGELAMLLGLETDAAVELEGELLERRHYELDALLEGSRNRPDLEAREASLCQAEAEVRLGEAQAWPELGLGLGYAHEEGDDILRGSVALSLPLFERGQGRQAVGRARRHRLGIELEARRTAVRTEVRTAYGLYTGLVEAVEHFEQEGLRDMGETDELMKCSYEAGLIPLGELLAARRELIEARIAYVDMLLEAALARIELEAAAGLLR